MPNSGNIATISGNTLTNSSIDLSTKADLVDGKIPSSQLPSYVDDILEYTNLAGFPATGSSGLIYVAQDTNKIYRWSGSAYVEISPSPGSTDSVAEGSTNLYFTNDRARAAISLTTTGTSGAATYSGGVLNIPQYQAAGSYLTAESDTLATVTSRGATSTTSITVNSSDWYGYVTNNGSGITAPRGAFFVNAYPSTTDRYYAQFSGNWASSLTWGLGVRGTGDDSIYFARNTSGVLDVTSAIKLYVGSGLVLHTSNYSTYALPITGGSLTGNLTFSTQGSKIIFGDSTTASPSMIGEGLVNTEGVDSDFLTIYFRNSLRVYSQTTEIGRFTNTGLRVYGTIIKDGGTSSEFLKADGSVDSSTYVSSSALSAYLPLAGGTMSGVLYGSGAGSFYIYNYGRIGLPNAGKILYNNGTGSNMFFGEISTDVYGFTGNAYSDTPTLAMNVSSRKVTINGNNPSGVLTVQSSADGNMFSIRGFISGYSYPNVIEMGVTGADGYFNIKDGAGNIQSSISGYTGTPTYFLSKLGVGTATPADKFEIYTGTYLKIKSFFDSPYTSGFKFSDYNGGIRYDAGNDRLTLFANYPSTAAAEITFETAGTEVVRISGVGYLGVGTTNPSYKLHVDGTSNADWLAGFINRGTNPYGLYVDTSANSGGAYTFAAYTNVGTGFFVLNSGNIGVGTASPTQNLHVAGGNLLLGSTSQPGTLQLGDYASSQNAKFIFSAAGSNNLDIVTNYSSGANVINIKPANALALSLYGDNRAYFTGNVGLNTTSPEARLEINSGLSSAVLSSGDNQTGADGLILRFNTTADLRNFGIKFQGGNYTYARIRGGTKTYGPDEGFISFETSSPYVGGNKLYTRMLIDGNGYVGIGNTSPGYRLDISGNTRITNGGTGAAYLYFSDTTTYSYLAYYNSDTYWRTSGGHYFEATSGFKGLWDSSGNLGIGTTTPGYKLDVNGNAAISSLLYANGGINIGSYVKMRWGNNNTPTLGLGLGDFGTALHIEVSDNDTGGLVISNDATTVYGAGDQGFVFRVIDEDSFQGGGGAEANTCFKVNQGAGGGGYMRGDFTATGDVIAYSDLRVKENIKPLTGALSKVMQLQGYYYNRNDLKDTSTKIGFIAQEVEPVIPELVTYDALQDKYGVSYGNATALLVEAIKEQQSQIESQKTEIEELKEILKRNNIQ